MKKWKRTLSLGVTLAVLFGASLVPAPVSANPDTTVTIDAPTQVGAGVHFRVRVNITDVTSLDACNYDVTYDPTKLELVGAEGEIGADKGVSNGDIGGTTIPVDMWGFIPEGEPGRIRIIQNIAGTTGVSGSGYLAELHFHVKAGVTSGSSAISLSDGCLSDTAATEISASWVNDSVTINAGLAATFNVNRTDCTAGVTSLTFTDTTSGGTSPYSYAWDFDNDGTPDSTDQNPTYDYSGFAAGTYDVKLTVTDSLPGGQAGEDTDDSALTTITVYVVPTADFSVNYTVGVSGRTSFTFTDCSTGGKQGAAGSEYTWDWDYGDETTHGTAQNPSHTYAVGKEGSRTVVLQITDTFSPGNVDSETKAGYLAVYCAGDASRTGESLAIDVVNANDITYLEHQMLAHEGYPVEAVVANDPGDANGDGTIDATDITKIELIILSI